MEISNVKIGNEMTYLKDVVARDRIQVIEDMLGDGIDVDKGFEYVDNTMTQEEINVMLTEHRNVRFKSGVYKVDVSVGYEVQSNQTIDLTDAIIEALPSNLTNSAIINIISKQNVVINGGTLIGERYSHIGTTGEWGMGVNIMDSKNVVLNDMVIKDTWGDGVYLGTSTSTGYCEDVALNRVVVDGCRRQGVSVISAKGFVMRDCICKNINGTHPEYGVCLEPNYSGQFMERVSINNLSTYNNNGGGLTLSTNIIPHVDIVVNGHTDDGNNNGRGSFSCSYGDDSPQSGQIVLNDCNYRRTIRCGIYSRNRSANKAPVYINNCTIHNANVSDYGIVKYASAITIYSEPQDEPKNMIGNIHVRNLNITGTTSKAMRPLYMYNEANPNGGVDKVSLIDPVNLDGCTDKGIVAWGEMGKFTLEDRYGVLVRSYDNSVSPASIDVHRVYDNKGATKTITFTVSKTIAAGVRLTFEAVQSGVAMHVRVDILGWEGHNGISIPYGNSATLESLGGGKWKMVSIVGTLSTI